MQVRHCHKCGKWVGLFVPDGVENDYRQTPRFLCIGCAEAADELASKTPESYISEKDM